MNVIFAAGTTKDLEYWKKIDPSTVKKINNLVENIKPIPFADLEKPEPLKYKKSGYWSRRISYFHRLVYKLDYSNLYIIQYRFHY